MQVLAHAEGKVVGVDNTSKYYEACFFVVVVTTPHRRMLWMTFIDTEYKQKNSPDLMCNHIH